MLIRANAKNLAKYQGNFLHDMEKLPKLIELCTKPLVKQPGVHLSHCIAERLGQINEVIGTHGVESMLLDEQGEDVSGSGDPRDVFYDIQYCNSGDTYGTTILWMEKDRDGGAFYIGDWGSVIEHIAAKGVRA